MTVAEHRDVSGTVTAEVHLAGALVRPWTYEQDPRWHLDLSYVAPSSGHPYGYTGERFAG